MAQKPIIMHQLKQVQQLKADGVPIKEIVRRTGISRKTVRKYLRNMEVLIERQESGKPAKITDKELAAIVYNNDAAPVAGKRFEALVGHFEQVKNELSGPGVTKQLLWMEYLSANTDGYQYSQYCYWFRKYLKDTDPAFHWQYRPAEFIQVDFTGKKLSWVDKATGEVIKCEVFVAILPYSGLIFCMGVPSQRTSDFVICINEMVKYFGGLSQTILCDNLKTAVKRSDRYEPVFTDICYQLSDHYNTTFSATRPARPTDKAMAEGAVRIVYTNVFAPLRKQVFHSLESLNRHIRVQLDLLNLKPYKNSPESRRDIFVRAEQALLKPLPEAPFQSKTCKQIIVQSNYAIQLPDNKHYYTVPYEYVGHTVSVCFNRSIVEVYHNHERIALHVRSSTEPKFNRVHEHMPPHHKAMVAIQGWTVEGLLQRASWVGEYTEAIASRILHSSIYPEQNYKACHAMILLQNKYSKGRLEAACRHAAAVAHPTLKMIRGMLKTGQDKQPLLFDEADKPLPGHGNIRGKNNYK